MRYNIDELKEKVREGYSMTSREVAHMALHELEEANFMSDEFHVKKANAYAQIALALKQAI